MKSVMLGAIVVLSLGTAAAQTFGEVRTVDFTQKISDLDGKPFKECVKPERDGKCEEELEVTLGHLVSRLLIARFAEEKDISLDEQNTRTFLAIKLYKAKDAVLGPEQVVLIKKLLPKMGWSNLVVTRICVAIDPTCRKER